MFTPETLEVVMVSFEGPDQYSQAGGLGVRARELCRAFAALGFRTTLVFVNTRRLSERRVRLAGDEEVDERCGSGARQHPLDLRQQPRTNLADRQIGDVVGSRKRSGKILTGAKSGRSTAVEQPLQRLADASKESLVHHGPVEDSVNVDDRRRAELARPAGRKLQRGGGNHALGVSRRQRNHHGIGDMLSGCGADHPTPPVRLDHLDLAAQLDVGTNRG